MKAAQETPKSSSKKPYSGQSSIDVLAAQCEKCHKWRVIQSEDEFEDIRSKLSEEPFYCNRRPGVSCEDPADIEYDSSRTWVVDKPNMKKTPEGFKRHLVLRKDYSKLDTYYITPEGKKLRSQNEIATILKGNPKYNGISPSDFDFGSPKVMEDTIPVDVPKKVPGSSNKKLKTTKD
ncbi:methyl-CpG-binding domain-containing protein 4-like [Argentina anserina]|uniref:methyl-CpG-binding domain-containing protein 4-like n=1 Tax=Argentina anserina TaxID=57926 RepID=UPI0021766425|nr:methyl-CpG-binding domain-containing protein 4-like [Potentilla anserina]